MILTSAKRLMLECVSGAGEFLMSRQGNIGLVSRKESLSSVVSTADFESEKLITGQIRAQFPDHNILGEETGLQQRGSKYTWVIDPLDGTGNFAAGLSWFAVSLALLEREKPIMAVMFVPCLGTLLFSERGGGVLVGDSPASLTTEFNLGNVLCAFGLDAKPEMLETRRAVALLLSLASKARGVRATNCVLDACLTLQGKFGAWLNNSCKIWDIAPACLMFHELGGTLTDWQGMEVNLDLTAEGCGRNYAVLAANTALHGQILSIMKEQEIQANGGRYPVDLGNLS